MTIFGGPWEYDQSGSPSRPDLPPVVSDPEVCPKRPQLLPEWNAPKDRRHSYRREVGKPVEVCRYCGSRKP